MLSASPVLPNKGALQDCISLAKAAYDSYRTRCFWYLSPGFKVEEPTLHIVIDGLRKYGDRAAFQIAADLHMACRQEVSGPLDESGRDLYDRNHEN